MYALVLHSVVVDWIGVSHKVWSNYNSDKKTINAYFAFKKSWENLTKVETEKLTFMRRVKGAGSYRNLGRFLNITSTGLAKTNTLLK